MYACIPEIGVGFFEGNARMGDRLLLFVTHPYLTIRELLGMGTGRSVGGCELYAVGTHYQTLLEGRDRGACLQRNHVPSPNLPHHPYVLGIGYENLAYAVSVCSAGLILEEYLISSLTFCRVQEILAPL